MSIFQKRKKNDVKWTFEKVRLHPDTYSSNARTAVTRYPDVGCKSPFSRPTIMLSLRIAQDFGEERNG